jgi:alpha-tubulin suppressor-like RCC1 family protein
MGVTSPIALAVGLSDTCAVLGDGTVHCWGWNRYGELGNGSTTDSSIPVAVPGITDAVGVADGAHHTCAVLSGGAVQCWGWNSMGELGEGTQTSRCSPVTVTGVTAAIAVDVNFYNS